MPNFIDFLREIIFSGGQLAACSAGSSRHRTAHWRNARPAIAKAKPPGAGTLGGSCLVETRPPKARGDTSGDGDTRESNAQVSGGASRAAIALWCNAIAPWYATVRRKMWDKLTSGGDAQRNTNKEPTMLSANRLAFVLAIGLSAAFASQALAQPNVNPPPPLTGQGPPLSDHRKAALMKCTNGIKFASDRYVNCMTRMGEAP
jgi:hypothetical protein